MNRSVLTINARRNGLVEGGKILKDEFAAVIESVRAIDEKIHIFSTFDPENIMAAAVEADAKNEKGRLWGVHIGLKSNICVKDQVTSCSSRILKDYRPPYHAMVSEKLLKEDAVLMSGLNMDEFAFGSSCESSYFGTTRNPWDLSRIPGGSSGGSAAAVASGAACAALGSDTGGSIRQPASLCGIVGMKPTYGRVSRYGLIAFASSLDQIGPLTGNVEDCATLLEIISGHDPKDSTSVNTEVPKFTASLSKDISGLKIGIPAEYFTSGIDVAVKDSVDKAIGLLRGLGAQMVDISLPHTKYAVSCYYIIAPAEASSNLSRYDGVHYGHRSDKSDDIIQMYTESRNEGFGDEAKRRILLGTYSLSSGYYDAYYLKAQKVRTLIADDFKNAFTECNCILTPTSPTTAFKVGERTEDPLKMYLSDVFTIPANLAGIPAVSVPCGFDDNGLPVGLQLMAPPFGEETLISVAHAYEKNADHGRKMPEVSVMKKKGSSKGHVKKASDSDRT